MNNINRQFGFPISSSSMAIRPTQSCSAPLLGFCPHGNAPESDQNVLLQQLSTAFYAGVKARLCDRSNNYGTPGTSSSHSSSGKRLQWSTQNPAKCFAFQPLILGIKTPLFSTIRLGPRFMIVQRTLRLRQPNFFQPKFF